MKKIIVIAAAIVCGHAARAQSVVLKFNPASGSKYSVTSSAASLIKQNMMGQDMEIKTDYVEGANIAISDSADVKKVAYTFSKLSLNMNMMGREMNMSSDAAEENDGNKLFKSFVGKTITGVVNSAGDVVKIYGLDALKGQVKDGQLGEITNKYLSEAMVKTRMEQLFKAAPGKSVKAGDTWNTSQTLNEPFPLTNTMVYKLNSVNAKEALVDISGTSTTNGDQNTHVQGMDVTVNMAGANTGTTVIDAVSGITQSLNLTSNIKGKVGVMGQELPMDVTTKAITTVTKL